MPLRPHIDNSLRILSAETFSWIYMRHSEPPDRRMEQARAHEIKVIGAVAASGKSKSIRNFRQSIATSYAIALNPGSELTSRVTSAMEFPGPPPLKVKNE